MSSKRLCVIVIALVVAALPACGGSRGAAGSGKTVSESALVLKAADVTVKAGSSKVSIAADFAGSGQSFAMLGDGVFDFKRQLGVMTFKLSGDTIPEAFNGYEMRFVRSTVYMKFPAEFAQIVPGLKTWVKIDVSELAKQQGLNLPGFNSFASQDPTSALAFARGAKSVRTIGPEKIRGEDTTHFTMTVDLTKAAEALPEAQRSGVEQLVAKAGISELPMDLWVDPQGRARRIKFSMDTSKLAAATGASPASGTMTIVMDLYEFGTPVTVAAPPAADISDYAELQKLSAPA